MAKPVPTPPPHSRWEILAETDPQIKKPQVQRKFRVRCTCGSGIERVLTYRYVRGESLSCGCLVRERAAEMGRKNLDALKLGYEKYLQVRPSSSVYSPKLPPLEQLVELRLTGMSCQQIADLYGATASAVSKRLRSATPSD